MSPQPKYRLQVHLDHIEQEKERLQKALAEEEEKLDQERSKLQLLQDECTQLEKTIARWKGEYQESLQSGGARIGDLQGRQAHLRRLRGDADEKKRESLAQERATTRAEKAVEKARAAFHKISNEVKIHQQNKERWLAEVRREELRREQKEIEEISTSIYERRRRNRR